MDANIEAALGTGYVGKIRFRSPGSQIQYYPQQYQVIKKLIADGKITTRSAPSGGSTSYDHIDNSIKIERGLPQQQLYPLIVHEITHAIQDWTDTKSTVGFYEADAYIAQQVVLAGFDKKYAEGSNPTSQAASMVLNGTAIASNESWRTAYNECVKLVLAQRRYSKQKKNADRNEGSGEKADFVAAKLSM